MSEEAVIQQQQIQPGPCPPEGCPPPTRIECIVVDKVYDSCFQVENRSRDTVVSTGAGNEWPTGTFTVGQAVPCALTAGQSISCSVVNSTPGQDGFATLTLVVSVPLTLANPNAPAETVDRVFTFSKIVTLCAPEGVNVDCSESTLLFCNCVISAVAADQVTVTCDFEVCLVVKTVLTVQLLVPSYGFCVPAPCVVVPGICPPSPPAQCT
ncbi:MAG: hypothetical protein IMW96_08870 [Thermoanaerobacteraceae bacterium]|uniref:hypothetical protein n=1 Tax=Thermanaeromonas sp. C210 TaxID=2731925 RepID=UPI00155D3A60|nr:hypothetical protein [Thermanaeromonas sp. C210]MBE3581723.1 hypothetical protein [Thermoanaerobacteraceae bacterium]GFN23729.1 hypothetical protein TAMC210_20460 [Thermanaeromonas sp. C210]